MDILEKIVAHKKEEIGERKGLVPVRRLERSLFFDTHPVSLSAYLQRPDLSGVIAEFKRRSPSKGIINGYADVEEVSIGYMQAGASALSVLTDQKFFGGSSEDLETARKFNYCPILRKDFIIDEYQVYESKAIGADAILLIARILSPEELVHLARLAGELGLEVLMEVHDEEELDKVNDHVHLVGVNSRNLEDFSVDTEQAARLAARLPQKVLKVAESGLNSAARVFEMEQAGFDGFLIGEHFMQYSRPGKACKALVEELEALRQNEKVSS